MYSEVSEIGIAEMMSLGECAFEDVSTGSLQTFPVKVNFTPVCHRKQISITCFSSTDPCLPKLCVIARYYVYKLSRVEFDTNFCSLPLRQSVGNHDTGT